MENLIALAVSAMFYALGVLSKDELASWVGNWKAHKQDVKQMLEQVQVENQEMRTELEFLRRLVDSDTVSSEDKSKLSQITQKYE